MEKPDWAAGDTLRSVTMILKQVADFAIEQTFGRLDSWLADYGDE